ncbi:MAG: hypothetical protein QOI04_1171 [Verrucomicrobiota bacterium]|jgi:hypothetical protein
MKLQLGPEIISSYKRLAYQAWYALAEFVDNSTQSYFDNKKALDQAYAAKREKLTVEINAGKDPRGEFIRIKDNSIGMDEPELKKAVYVGRPPSDTSGRSRYGLGLKTGASWFGDLWTVETKKLGSTIRHVITVDVPKVAAHSLELPHKEKKALREEHGTTIEIRRLHQKLVGRTLGKAKEYLRSLYRRDISKGRLVLKVNGEVLSWDADVDKKLHKLEDGSLAKTTFNFKIRGKPVSGWAGVWERGSRRNAGLSIIQSDRVITGWPDSYRPATLYGEQEGGSNDLVNQRLFGELELEGFEVSHTKDRILFQDGEQEALELKLKEELGGLRQIALTHRKDPNRNKKVATNAQRNKALNDLEHELELAEIRTFLKTYEVPSASLVKKANESLKNAIVRNLRPDLKTRINRTIISVYLVGDMSPNDPYVIIEATKSETSVIVIINLAHPHWEQLTNDESILNFIRHCTYDGVSESKAWFATHSLQPDTIKLIKDNLLRIPMTLRTAT